MKKLKVALSVLFALTCSLFLFACTSNSAKQIVEINITGQKTTFAEGESFEMGTGAVVTVIYQGSDEEVTLTADQYDVDSTQFQSNEAGEYTIIVTPKDQPEDSSPVTKEYSVTVNHNFQDKGNGLEECVGCKATRRTLTGLTTKVTTQAWDTTAELDQGTNGYPEAKAPAAGERHVSLGTLIKGQAVTFTLKIEEVDTSSVWNTPLMGIRNGTDGVLPREDVWVIGTATGYTSPFAPGGVGATNGTATSTSTEWEVFGQGTSWTAADIEGATIKITYDYQMSDIFMIRHELIGAQNLIYTYTLRVPDASYELVAYGEKVTYTIMDSAFTAGRTVTEFTATEPTNKIQPEGKMFDSTGITTTAKFSKGNDVQNIGNYYAYVGEGENARKVNLGVEPLIAGMYDFSVEFGGETWYFTSNGQAGGDSLITVVENYISGANAVIIEMDEVAFESPDIALDYTLNANKDGIRLVFADIDGVKSRAAKLTETQKAALDVNENHFVAFRLISTRAFDEAESANAKVTVVNGENDLKNVDVIVPIGTGRGTFDIHFKLEGEEVFTLTVDLGNLDTALPAASAEIIEENFTLDEGGTYVVRYSGLTSPTSVKLILLGNEVDYATVNGGLSGEGYAIIPGTIAITALKAEGSALEVTYNLPKPNLQNLSAEDFLRNEVGVVEGTETTRIKLAYTFEMSENAHNIGNDTYVFVADDKLIVMAMSSLKDVRDGSFEMSALLNIQNEYATSLNVGLRIADGAATIVDENDITLDSRTESRLLVIGGNVNDNSDYDRGAVLMILLHLPAVGIRETNVAETFYFTGNEDTTNGQKEYEIFKAEGNTITSEKVTPTGARTARVPLDCVTDGVDSFEYKISDSETFYYGALVVPATGAHAWKAVVGSTTKDECDVCHYTRELIDGNYFIRRPAVSFENEDTTGDWWDFATGATKVSGDFILEYTYDMARDSWKDIVVQMTDGADWGTFEVYGTNAAWASDKLTANIKVAKVELNGQEVKDDTGAAKLEDPASWIGVHTLTFTRIGNQMTIVADYVGKNATDCTKPSGDIFEADNGKLSQGKQLPFTGDTNVHYTVTYIIENCTESDLTIQLAGNPYWVDNLAKVTGEVQTYAGTVVINSKSYDLGFKKAFAVENTDKSGDWWDFATGATKVSGDFVLKYTYDMARDSWKDIVVQMTDGADWGTFEVYGTNAAWASDKLTVNIKVAKVELNGQEVKDDTGAAKLEDPASWIGVHTLMFVRIGNEMTIVADYVGKNATDCTKPSGDIFEADNGKLSQGKQLPFTGDTNVHYTVTYVIENCTESDLTIQLGGNPYWVDNITTAFGYATPTTR